MTITTVVTGIQVVTTAAIILVPALANHPINPLRKRADTALERLRKREDDIFELVNIPQAIESPESEKDVIFKKFWEELDGNVNDLSEIKVEAQETLTLETGYVERGDTGFRIVLDAVSQNRSVRKSEVAAIGLLYSDAQLLDALSKNEDMPQGSRVPISPNAALFVDYEGSGLPDREIITYYPESPSLTLSLHELENWMQEAIRRKSHYMVIILTLIWTTSSLVSEVI